MVKGLSEKEKQKIRQTEIFDMAKNFIANLNEFIDTDASNWVLLQDKMDLKSKGELTLKFALKDGVIEEKIIEMDRAQKKVDDYGQDEEEGLAVLGELEDEF
jgi:hypothetical protein